MTHLATSELTFPERAILATSASAANLDHFSSADRIWAPVFQQSAQLIRKRTYYSGSQAFVVEWQDYGPLPRWFDPLVQGFVDVLTLPPNWDSYQAKTIDPQIVRDAMNFVVGVLAPGTPAPRVMPLSNGGIQLEWHRNGIDVEVVFDLGDQPYFFYTNHNTGEESEHPLENAGLLKSVIACLE
jgi:hypothetical protein